MHYPFTFSTAFLALIIGSLDLPRTHANSDIFPPEPDAKSSIDFDGRGFLVQGQRVFIASGTIHYPRVPRELWRDRLLRLKRAGFNCVETYAFWNYNEAQEGKFDFSGNGDLGAFLDLAHEVGLYAIVRVGPYVCAEWEDGGYPIWLRFKSGVRVREDNPEYLALNDLWYAQALDIVAKHQINKGGSVIMVQLENEHPRGWGTDMNSYFSHLLATARTAGIEVPTFFSGLHHGSDPAPGKPESSAGRKSPWFTTEFWPGWYTNYGPLPATGDRSVRRYERGTWRILATGGNGYNFYMIHGGTNFATWNDDEMSASYDYGTAIGQTGDLRTLYYRFKRPTMFARSFETIMADSDNSTDAFADAAANVVPWGTEKPAGATVAARTGPAGTVVFLDNPSNQPISTQLKNGVSLNLEPGETVGLVHDFILNPVFKIKESSSRILGFARQGDTTTLVIYGAAGDPGRLDIAVTGPATPGSDAWTVTSSGATLNVKFPATGPDEYALTVGKDRLRVLALSKEGADRTWLVDAQGITYVVCGPNYVGDFQINAGKATLTAEDPLNSATTDPVLVYSTDTQPQKLGDQTSALAKSPEAPKLQSWQSFSATAEATPDFNDSTWKTSDDPLPMGADGDTSAYAWYRASFNSPTAGTQSLQIPFVGDYAAVFINGKQVPASASHSSMTIPVEVKSGANTIALLVSHYGREKYFNMIGPIERLDVKGIAGPVTLSPSPRPFFPLNKWKVKDTGKDPSENLADPEVSTDKGWRDVRPDAGASHYSTEDSRSGFTWHRITLPDLAGPNRRVHFGFVYDNAVIYLNGQKLGTAPGPGVPFEISLDPAWKESGPNVLAVQVEGTSSFGGIIGQPYVTSQDPDIVIKGWKMRGNVLDGQDPALSWQPLTTVLGEPTCYRTTFSYAPADNAGATLILRASTKGLSRGFMWLNGHNLGRFPEKVPVDGLYLPEPWIKPGDNTLIVFDEQGKTPDQVKLYVETAASRHVSNLGQ